MLEMQAKLRTGQLQSGDVIGTFLGQGNVESLRQKTGLNRTTEQDIQQNVLFVKLYFSTLNYVENIDRESFDQSTLVANIGGFMGLFLGASVVTLCEIGEVLVHLAVAGVRKMTHFCQSPRIQHKEPK